MNEETRLRCPFVKNDKANAKKSYWLFIICTRFHVNPFLDYISGAPRRYCLSMHC
jgi:hypothetical protein